MSTYNHKTHFLQTQKQYPFLKTDSEIYDFMDVLAGYEDFYNHRTQMWEKSQIPRHQISEEIEDEILDYNIWFHKQLLQSPKSPCRPSNSSPIDTGYVYWVTLTPKDGENERELRDYINYLKDYNPQILGAFERGANDKFHAHFVIHHDRFAIDTSKTPYIKYTKNMGIIKNKVNLFRLNNWESTLVKLRYMLKESKENYGYFGDYDYYNNIIKYKLDQTIINLERYETIKEFFNN